MGYKYKYARLTMQERKGTKRTRTTANYGSSLLTQNLYVVHHWRDMVSFSERKPIKNRKSVPYLILRTDYLSLGEKKVPFGY